MPQYLAEYGLDSYMDCVLLSCTAGSRKPDPAIFRLAERAHRASLDIRREGSAALDLCSVAAGRAGGYFEPHPRPGGDPRHHPPGERNRDAVSRRS